MSKPLKSWDQYVQDAQRDPQIMQLSDGSVLTFNMPTTGAIERMNDAQQKGDVKLALAELLGNDNASKVLALAEDAPFGALQELLKDVLAGFGLETAGELSASLSS